MKKIPGVLILGLFVVAAFSVRLLADEEACCQGMEMGMHGKMMGGMGERMSKAMALEEMFSHKVHLITEYAADLGLSDDQIQKVKTLKRGVKKSMIRGSAELGVLSLDIEEALEKGEIDVNSTNALMDKKYNIKSQDAKKLVSAYADLKNILSADQIKKLHELQKKEKME